MPLQSAMSAPGLIPYEDYIQGKQSAAREERYAEDDDDDEIALTPEEQEEFEILKFCSRLYDDARRAREPYETFDMAWDLYIGNVWNRPWPAHRARITINKIRAFITFMQAVMTDNKPRISVEPLVPGSEDAADLLRKLVDRDWDENDMQGKLAVFVLYGLIWGTSFIKITYDPYADGGRGKHVATPIAPYRVFANRTATSIEDAEYLIHVEDMTMGWIRRNFPDKAKACWRLRGIHTGDHTSSRDRDYIREGDGQPVQRIVSAQNVNGHITAPQYARGNSQHLEQDNDDTVEVGEFWLRDDSLESYERQKIVNGVKQTQPMVGPDGLYVFEQVGTRPAVSEIDGAPFLMPVMQPKQEPVMETCWRPKFPNGRLVLIAGGRVLLRDIPNPYQTDGFPWAMWKDYDVGAFWGQGEPLALKDCAIASNKILSQVFDILEKIGSPSYLLKKGAGVNATSIKSKPGLIIPMDDMDGIKALDKPQIPAEFLQLFSVIQKSMGEVSGLNEAVTGALPGGNTAFATMDQLQESGAAPIRQKVRNLETGISRIGKLRVQLIQQWDSGKRPIRDRSDAMEGEASGSVVAPAANNATKFRHYSNPDLQGTVEFGVVPISSLSTSPAGTWNRYMSLYDKKLIDDIWFHRKFRIEGWRSELPRMLKQRQANQAVDAAAKHASKVKPGPKGSRPPNHPQNNKAPASNVPSRLQNSSVR
jgi:hypothetical protein